MNREILFRGKRVDNGAWETGSFVGIRIWCSDARTYIADKMTGYNTPVIPETVGQYTGLIDKNGKRIYEGDVLKMEIKSNYINPLQAPLVFIGVCKFKDGAFGFSKQRAGIEEFTAFSSTTYNVEFEIIGNIHDNAELLEVTE